MSYVAAADRYDGKIGYRRCGRSGLDLPLLSLVDIWADARRGEW